MDFPQDQPGRIGRSKYWTMFFVNMVAVIVLIGVTIGAAVEGSWGLAIIAFLLVAPVGIYFRVVMMRRCRDIGWSPALPWIALGAQIAVGVFNFGSIAAASPSALIGGVGFSWLVSLADFGLTMALGIVKGRSEMNYQQVFGDYQEAPAQRTAPRQPSGSDAPHPSMATGDSDAMDDAIARALDNYKRTGSAVPQQQAPVRSKPAAPRPAAPPPRQAGFGRKMV